VADKPVILVEGFFAVVKLYDLGFPNVVATMGAELSVHQAKLLGDFPEVFILFDGDEAGQTGATTARSRLAPSVTTRLIRLPPTIKPDDLPAKMLRWLVNGMHALDLAEVAFTPTKTP